MLVRDRVRVERIALEIAGGQNEVVEAVQDEASPTPVCCPVSPQKRRIFCLEKARAFSGLVFQKLKSLAAATRAMDVQRLYQLVESSPNAPRTRPTTAYAPDPSRAPYFKSLASIGPTVPRAVPWTVGLVVQRASL